MFCTNCGKKIDEKKVEAKSATLSKVDIETEISEDAEVVYACPRCGEHIHHNISEDETKSLSRAAHEQYQKGCNSFAVGMECVCIGVIAAIIAVIFFILAKKPANQHVLDPTCTEFYVSMILFGAALVLLSVGGSYVGIGIYKRVIYTRVLKDINNEVFIQ
ncbi:MAG: hypothetical protein LUC16_01085 [Coprobacillus sp.]|nr:hypothetical protein [Coprobacillus sp.]